MFLITQDYLLAGSRKAYNTEKDHMHTSKSIQLYILLNSINKLLSNCFISVIVDSRTEEMRWNKQTKKELLFWDSI